MMNPRDVKTIQDAMRIVEERGLTHIKVGLFDTDGVMRGKYMNKEKFFSSLESGFAFCDVVLGWDSNDKLYEDVGIKYTGWHTGYPDAGARLDLSTIRRIPWEQGRPLVLGEFVDDRGEPLPVCPRQLLRRVVDRATSRELIPRFALEFEWFNFSEPVDSAADKEYRNLTPADPGMCGYSVIRQSTQAPYFEALLSGLDQYDIPIEGLHTETGPGVLEAAIVHAEAVEAATEALLECVGVPDAVEAIECKAA